MRHFVAHSHPLTPRQSSERMVMSAANCQGALRTIAQVGCQPQGFTKRPDCDTRHVRTRAGLEFPFRTSLEALRAR
jgi:hypothetical protein